MQVEESKQKKQKLVHWKLSYREKSMKQKKLFFKKYQ